MKFSNRTNVVIIGGLIALLGWLTLTGRGRTVARMIGGKIVELSTAGLDKLKHEEGFSPVPYPDAQGFSIGYGHFILPHEKDTLKRITEDQGRELLRRDTLIASNAVKRLVKVPLTQNQFDALVSFVYNVGEGAFSKSTLLRQLNAKNYAAAANQFPIWNKMTTPAGTKVVVAALDKRRANEQLLFMSA